MDYFSQKLRDFANIFFTQYANKQQQEQKTRQVSRYEVYLEYIYKILIWEEATLTCFVFLTLNFLFW